MTAYTLTSVVLFGTLTIGCIRLRSRAGAKEDIFPIVLFGLMTVWGCHLLLRSVGQ